MARAVTRAKKKKPSSKEQFERFEETARKLGADDSMEEFEAKFQKVVPPKKGPKSAS